MTGTHEEQGRGWDRHPFQSGIRGRRPALASGRASARHEPAEIMPLVGSLRFRRPPLLRPVCAAPLKGGKGGSDGARRGTGQGRRRPCCQRGGPGRLAA